MTDLYYKVKWTSYDYFTCDNYALFDTVTLICDISIKLLFNLTVIIIALDLKTDENLQATYKGIPWVVVDKGVVVANCIYCFVVLNEIKNESTVEFEIVLTLADIGLDL
ncbi:aminoacyl tRNA synthase complex-interacting multifunctional protein 1 [Aphis craccivora]|uniref:Aminoacyl tRNA synthase complex-interacting multifunctional protein 1 n=1 Tax=Aphis craccivora TaxID=307492 RepID=A0A6G0Y7Q2_APHCR|nr:aminoacyl tRNA synthase complex-interacting multifunctional protein 1 [Aphis craccivora]